MRKSWISRQEHFWDVANTTSFPVAIGSILDAALVVPADFAVRVGYERVTVIRMRGWLAAQATIAGAQSFVAGCIVVRPAGAAVLDPTTTATLRDNDILATFGGHVAKVANGDHSQVFYMPIDVKTRRVIKEDEEIDLYVKAPSADVNFSYAIRTLVVSK